MTNDGCIVVFTSRPVREMRANRASHAWVLDAKRARRQPYLVTAWNSLGEHARNSGGRSHGEGFLVAKISAVEEAPAGGATRRYSIRFNEYARISEPDLWPRGQRNPVFYSTLSALGIDADDLEFKAIDGVAHADPELENVTPDVVPLTIAAAKRGLAAQFGVDPAAIEIVVRG